jgi:hypothetical protein
MPTGDMRAGVLNKPLQNDLFRQMRARLMGISGRAAGGKTMDAPETRVCSELSRLVSDGRLASGSFCCALAGLVDFVCTVPSVRQEYTQRTGPV